jgi:hypothetical protein
MTRVSAELEVLLADAVRTATHSHNPPYGRALLIVEILGVVERALVGPKYSNQERRSVRQVTLEAGNHGRRMCP